LVKECFFSLLASLLLFPFFSFVSHFLATTKWATKTKLKNKKEKKRTLSKNNSSKKKRKLSPTYVFDPSSSSSKLKN